MPLRESPARERMCQERNNASVATHRPPAAPAHVSITCQRAHLGFATATACGDNIHGGRPSSRTARRSQLPSPPARFRPAGATKLSGNRVLHENVGSSEWLAGPHSTVIARPSAIRRLFGAWRRDALAPSSLFCADYSALPPPSTPLSPFAHDRRRHGQC